MVKRLSELTGLDKDHAERALRATLVTLGTRIDPGEADDLAAQLPDPFAACLRHELHPERFGPAELVRRVVHLVPLSREQAEKAVRSVFLVLSEAVTEGELDDIRSQLGHDFSDLVGAPTGRTL